jgi:two-component system nitrate/nitrite response regulator NarL
MRVLLAGPARARDTLRTQLAGSPIEVVGEFDSIDEARQSGVDADAVLSALARPSRPRARSEAFEEPLTPREIEVLELLAEGLPNKAIATRLGVSDQTVKFHVAAIIAKLGAANRTEAVRRAIHRGVIAM